MDQAIANLLPEYSRNRISRWIRDGHVVIAGQSIQPKTRVYGGESVEVSPGDLPPLKASPEALPVDILFEDDSVIAVNKPAGIVVHAGAGNHAGTLVNRLVHHFQSLSQVGGELRPGITWATRSVISALNGMVPDNVYNREVIPRWKERFGGAPVIG